MTAPQKRMPGCGGQACANFTTSNPIVNGSDAERKGAAAATRPLLAACRCQAQGSCATCSAWRSVFDDVADRRAEAVEAAMEDRRMRLALARQHTDRRPVRAFPANKRIDLDALADAVALRLRRHE